MGEPIKECWDRRQYHTGLAHIKRNRRTQFGILGAAIKPKWDGPTYPKGMTQLTNVAGPTLVKPAGPLQVSGLKILTSIFGNWPYRLVTTCYYRNNGIKEVSARGRPER